MMSPLFKFSYHFCRSLLAIFPAEFREEYGALMLQMYIDRCREEGTERNPALALRLLVETSIDWIVSAVREHFDILRQDLRYSLRRLIKNPGFTGVAVLALGLGIGSTTAIFSVFYALLLRPLPYVEPERLVNLWRVQAPLTQAPVSELTFQEWRKQSRTFDELAAYSGASFDLASRGDRPDRLWGLQVTDNFWQVLGARPRPGQPFLPGEDTVGHNNVVILSHSLWQRRFGADSRILGSQILLSGKLYTVVGIAPSDFEFPGDPEFWTPLALKPQGNDGNNYLWVFARRCRLATASGGGIPGLLPARP